MQNPGKSLKTQGFFVCVQIEEEWEYASTHNGTKHRDTFYAMGEMLEHCVNAQYVDYNNMYCQGNAAAELETRNQQDGTGDVSLHTPAGDSPLGLVDMSGNVWEWTKSLDSSGTSFYILKGGSWNNYESELRVTARRTGYINSDENGFGFRCVKD